MNNPTPPSFYNDLDASFTQAWDLLSGAKKPRHSPFHTPIVATTDKNGEPQARVMVLRSADIQTRQLRFHTDKRSSKVDELAANNAITVLGYDPVMKIQLRMRGLGRIESNSPTADLAWDKTGLSSRKCYLAAPAPGAASDIPTSGLKDEWATRDPTEAESQPGRANFAILLVDILEIEWVYLASQGHRRAQFTWNDDNWMKVWLIP
jgi:pyridoxamine 5'-phosphate oxidase